jgi:hypothetical protein
MLAVIKDDTVVNIVEGDEGLIDHVKSITGGTVVFIDEEQNPNVAIGHSYIDGEFIPPEPIIIEITDEQISTNVRSQRDFLLAQSDIKMLYDNWNSMSTTLKGKWTTYRQELRDLPEQEGFPREVVWPVEP